MKYKRLAVSLLSFIPPFLASLPLVAIAQTQATYELLAPIGTLTSAPVTLKKYVDDIFITAIGLTGVIAVIMLVVCGIRLMGSASAAGKSEAKQCIWNTIFGILLVIGSWLLLNTINPLLLKDDAYLSVNAQGITVPPPAARTDPIPREPGWYFRYRDANGNTKNSPKVVSPEACLQMQQKEKDNGSTIVQECFEISKPPVGTSPPPSSNTIPPPTQSGSEQATRNALCGNDSCVGSKPLGIKRNACNPPNINGITNGCTNVAGLDNGVVSFLKGLPGACNCEIVITGGTEEGHSSHGPGIPVFDLRISPTLMDFIKTNASVKANPSFCYTPQAGQTKSTCFQKWLYNGYWFTDESLGASHGAHWHVCREGTAAPAGKSANLFRKACTQI